MRLQIKSLPKWQFWPLTSRWTPVIARSGHMPWPELMARFCVGPTRPVFVSESVSDIATISSHWNGYRLWRLMCESVPPSVLSSSEPDMAKLSTGRRR